MLGRKRVGDDAESDLSIACSYQQDFAAVPD